MNNYATKNLSYFRNARKDILPLLPARAAQVLEIGCGSGETLAWLKQECRVGTTFGIELFSGAAQEARARVDQVLCGPAETMLDELAVDEQFDLVLCLDVLEHMFDPWAFVSKLQARIRPGGLFIASIPNVRYVGVTLPLLFGGRWQYQESGILDRTHLRFFTRETSIELISLAGLRVERCIGNVPPPSTLVGIADRLSFGLLGGLLAVQWLIAARKNGVSE